VLNEPRNITELCETGDIGIGINPKDYSAQVAQEFMGKLENKAWEASALMFHNDDIYDVPLVKTKTFSFLVNQIFPIRMC